MGRAEAIKNWPVLRTLLAWRYERLFRAARGKNLFRGIYPDFAAALRAAPPTKPVGYDHPEAGDLYKERVTGVVDSDYPVMFWLQNALADGADVFDFGGHVGLAFHAYQRLFAFPARVKWTVCDVLEVTKAGERLAAEKKATNLSFVNSVRERSGADVLLAAGSLQYLEEDMIAAMINGWAKKPGHVIVNKLPVHAGRPFVTLQNMSTAFCPYRIFQREAFVLSVERLGYELKAAWKTPESCYIPGAPDESIARYSGFYFIRRF